MSNESSDEKVNPFTSSKCQDNTSPLSEYRGDPDEISADDGSMTDSYMEISRQIDISPIPNNNMSTSDYSDSIGAAKGGGESSGNRNWEHRRPDSLVGDRTFPYNLDGIVSKDGEMTHFVTENLEYKIKLSSPVTRKDIGGLYLRHNSTPSSSGGLGPTRSFFGTSAQQQQPQVDSNVLNDIEIEAQYLAASLDNLTENLCNLLHSISSITADNVEIHKNAVNKLTDSMDANIKSMYTIMAKTEEISKSMKPTEQLATRIREIKRLVDMLESNM
ncbi:unnamed protein product [Hermetia illucens]|uniref:BLOC-1-related complex subunit 6 C-terminal helix domain-containing protein n=1 Tax=Hermetia illucens TaxID=343691 RepID=A0A7R8V7X7_HERIL|nr:BLOC-1-related complex subunit 6 isoform X1 [Hermetia illucens]CAD7094094.1 unnamed protein product [Hermetia illucens]